MSVLYCSWDIAAFNWHPGWLSCQRRISLIQHVLDKSMLVISLPCHSLRAFKELLLSFSLNGLHLFPYTLLPLREDIELICLQLLGCHLIPNNLTITSFSSLSLKYFPSKFYQAMVILCLNALWACVPILPVFLSLCQVIYATQMAKSIFLCMCIKNESNRVRIISTLSMACECFIPFISALFFFFFKWTCRCLEVILWGPLWK